MRMAPEVAVAAPAAETTSDEGSMSDKKCQRRVPKKAHKSEREKLKRDQLNDLFTELGNMLEPDRQNNGKACILVETTRLLRELLSQVESLRKENSTLRTESDYVSAERSELQDEVDMLRKSMCELQNELTARACPGPGFWTDRVVADVPREPALPIPHPMTALAPLQPPPTVIEHVYSAAPPRELQLFPESAPVRDDEPPLDRDSIRQVQRPQARYAQPSESWPGRLFVCMSRTDEEATGGT